MTNSRIETFVPAAHDLAATRPEFADCPMAVVAELAVSAA